MGQDRLGLKIGGIKILLRSEGFSLRRLAEVYRQFLFRGDSHDLTLDILIVPWRETNFLTLGPSQQDLLFYFYWHYRDIFDHFSPASNFDPLIKDILAWIRGYLCSEEIAELLAEFPYKKDKPIYVQPVGVQKEHERTGGLLFLEQGRKAGKFLWLELLADWGVTLELLNLLLFLAYAMVVSEHDGFFLHSSGVAKRDRCYLFTGFPKSGKTTVANLARGFTVLADDGIPVRRGGSDFWASSTPWNSMYPPWDGSFGEIVEDVKIEKVFFLNRGSGVSFKKLTPAESVARLIRHVIPRLVWLNYYDAKEARKAFELCSQFCRVVPCYDMYFTLKEDFWGEINKLP
jgi:hypothetical protein